MWKIRKLIVIATVLAITACSSVQSSDSTPTTSTPAATAAAKQEPSRLHWNDWASQQPPANLNSLRSAVDEIGDTLALEGYTPISEAVDDDLNPTVLTTQWLNGDTLVEVHSTYGVTAFTFKRPNPKTDGKTYSVMWYRCAASEGIIGDYHTQLAELAGKSADDLKAASCHEVTFGN